MIELIPASLNGKAPSGVELPVGVQAGAHPAWCLELGAPLLELPELFVAITMGERQMEGVAVRREGEVLISLASASKPYLSGELDPRGFTRVLGEVKHALEWELGTWLSFCTVVTPGNLVETTQAKASATLAGGGVSQAALRALELKAMNAALPPGARLMGVGAARFRLDGRAVEKPLGQLGETFDIELSVAYCAAEVIDALLAMCHANDLEPVRLMPAPLATLQAIVPRWGLQHPLTLVNVGLESSQVSIFQAGTLMAASPCLEAQQAFQAAIADTFHVQIETAGRLRRQLMAEGTLGFTDRAGLAHNLSTADLRATLRPAIAALGARLAKETITLAHQTPPVTLLTGELSQFEGFQEYMALALGVPTGRVICREHALLQAGPVPGGPPLQEEQIAQPLSIAVSEAPEMVVEPSALVLVIPQAEPPLELLPPVEEPPAEPVAASTRPSLMMIEDDEVISFALSYMLKREGFDLSIASDGQKGLELIDASAPPDIVLLDLMLPQLDGFQLIAHIRQKPEWADVPILMLTSNSHERDIVRALTAGANDYILKPFQPQELVARLKRYLIKAAV